MQCFKGNCNAYLLKELAVVNIESGTILLHHIVYPPYDRSMLTVEKLRESYWVTKHCHGIDWEIGDIPYNVAIAKLSVVLTTVAVYVKGEEKRRYVQALVPTHCTVCVLFADGCHSLEVFATAIHCKNHRGPQHRCTLANCSSCASGSC